MMRWIRCILGRESRHTATESRTQRTNEMLTALSARKRTVERDVRRTGDWFEGTFYPRSTQDDHRKGAQE